jgi:protein phosphatase
MEFFATSDIGKKRQTNEDCYLADSEDSLFIVADGMGGHQAGEIASKTAIENFTLHFKKEFNKQKNIRSPKSNAHLNKSALAEEKIKKILKDSARHANKIIYKLGLENDEMSGMGTTFTGLIVLENKAFVVHAGDSRLYLFRENSLERKTEDHTFVFQLYRSGAITYEDTFSHPQRNYLTSVLGEKEISSLDCFCFGLQEKDIILVCSDGLNSMIADDLIGKIIKNFQGSDAGVIAKKLTWQANKNGGMDNITAIIVKI